MKILMKIFSILFLIISVSTAQSLQLHHSKSDIYCKECHSCDKPTERDPCLKCCPEFTRKGITIRHSIDKAPEILTIDIIADQYEPSVFSHRLHAEMADMAGGCILCHHYNPPGKVASCRECHKATRQRINLRKPDLKAAYHRQCLGCHLEWKHENDCIKCHALKIETEGEKIIEEKRIENKVAELKEKKHSPILSPDKKVYTTEFDEGKLVTFYHNDHIKMYNLSCADCHQNEKCGSCHDVTGKTSFTEKESHDNCVSCHENEIDDNCEKCHSDKEKPPFNHGLSTGWELKIYHQRLNCRACHGDKKKITKVKRSCSICHKSWDVEKFDHSVTGLALDENHLENECEVCHPNNNFIKKPFCSECHEEDISYPKSKPGKKIDK